MMKYITGTSGIVVLAVIILLVLSIAPMLLFWSIETLFGIVIPLTVWTWLATWVLFALLRGGK